MTGADAIAGMRAGIRRTLRQHSSHRPGLRLWTLLHARSLLDGPGSGAHVTAFIEDDYRRLAAARQETLEPRAQVQALQVNRLRGSGDGIPGGCRD